MGWGLVRIRGKGWPLNVLSDLLSASAVPDQTAGEHHVGRCGGFQGVWEARSVKGRS